MSIVSISSNRSLTGNAGSPENDGSTQLSWSGRFRTFFLQGGLEQYKVAGHGLPASLPTEASAAREDQPFLHGAYPKKAWSCSCGRIQTNMPTKLLHQDT